MTANFNPADYDVLDLYLDGLLEGKALEDFERRLASDESLRRQVEEHRRAEAALRRAFAPPPVRIRPSSAPWPRLPIPTRYLAWAAVVLIALIVGVWYYRSAAAGGGVPRLTPDQVYDRLVKGGFHPQFVCTTDEEFNREVRKKFGQGMLIASSPNIELIGWAYSSPSVGVVVSEQEWILLARVDGRETIVIMDRAERDRRVKVDPCRGMNLFKRRVGDIVLYELTQADAPSLINRAYVPDAAK